jgi:BirA family biotin operon repressor/biotin-[acetyl-CoA-carboxylase] ligase
MDLDSKVLQIFLHAKGQYISGASIGDQLGLSRVSIHNHLESLRKDGFEFSAIRNKGYRLDKEPNAFHPALFGALIEDSPCPFFDNYITLEDTPSTNNVADSELSMGRQDPFFVVADCQTSGRGRRGRVWHSPKQKNLYLSIALRPAMSPARLQTITLWLGLRLCQYLRDNHAVPVMIKWPNDLLLHDRKIAGMLTEARVDSEQTRDLVFGFGLNVNSVQEDFPDELQSIASSMAMETGKQINLSRLALGIVQHLSVAMRDYLENNYSSELARLWPEYDYLRGQYINTETISGKAIGISPTGSLKLEREDGSTALLHSGEVSIGTGSG